MATTIKNTPRAGTERVDAHDKVRGVTRYAADDARAGLLHAALVPSRIARGRIAGIDTAAAQRVRGVRAVLTHENVGAFDSGGFLMGGGFGFQSVYPLRSAQIAYRGQSVAMVVADTLEAAREAAALVAVAYEAAPFVATLDAPDAEPLAQTAVLPQPMFADRRVGDPEGALAGAAVTVDLRYTLPAQHQNPMEIIATVAEWDGEGVLTVHEPTQNAEGVRHGVAKQLGLDAARVRVLSPSLGGGFGQKNSLQSHTALVAIAARTLGRPVKLVMTRAQLFHNASFRPASRHRVRLGADRNGRLLAAIHEIDQQTSRHDLFPSMGTEITSRLYGIQNFLGQERLVRTDVQTPGYMRAPFEHPAAFAFESAIDEMAYALDRDPVALRLANDAAADPLTGKPFSSRHVAECLVKGSEMFGWARRTMAPGSMRAPDGSQVGWGVAIGTYKAAMAPAIATVRLRSNGTVRVAVGGHEMGQGMRTAIAVTVARALGAPVAAVEILLGDTTAAPQHLTAGSWGTATALPPVQEAAQRLMDDLRQHAGAAAGEAGVTALALLRASGRPFAEAESRRRAPGQPEQVFGRLTGGLPAAAGPVYPDFVGFSFIAHFVEVRIEPTTRRIRVPRVVSVADCGIVASPRTARSQVEGGVVWGIGAALREVSEVDPRYGGFLNADLAEYVLPVAADIGRIEVDFVGKPDTRLNALGVKGLGEVAMVGVAPAIVNAVFHATGKRLRRLPLMLEDLL
ncbi:MULTISPECIES: xanthine dehydrogenase family protein molybdopterin-binding subunit [unclassified Variovorax]|uniref:xanthine dehydrogenase family protein molybdopterin-binding subunit n=1 Tax=unclassified Variovorax TaxID=663243 RepID=UPI002577B887|nr:MULTISPECIES: xanthine dehydrogenase family protein molybdopterin-binding subunit [unclassified Variovorax]MDM0087018.1 xanthine dehydrogenase family protein molybdopterin-binding subunit [Variovorax sp. J22G40]MDM0144725.1 xanthine dehydrogenase family protein molybdopterin-binding subunit [Variovorax sp. J2P1-31]